MARMMLDANQSVTRRGVMKLEFLLASRKLYTYMSKLFTLNDNVMATQEAIEEASQVQLDLKVECQKALFDHKKFLTEQEQLRSQRLQKTHPAIVE